MDYAYLSGPLIGGRAVVLQGFVSLIIDYKWISNYKACITSSGGLTIDSISGSVNLGNGRYIGFSL